MTHQKARSRLVLLLAFTSGVVDATGFLALGGAFTSVMTGNMVLLGVSLGAGDKTLALHVGVAVVSYIVGCWMGSHLAGSPKSGDSWWPPPANITLGAEVAVLACVAALWWISGANPKGNWGDIMTGLCASALGLQGSAVARFGIPGLSTTYLTGTLTSIAMSVARLRFTSSVVTGVQLIVSLVAGASAASILLTTAPLVLPALWLMPVPIAICVSVYLARKHESTVRH